jgi:hypothetical protein
MLKIVVGSLDIRTNAAITTIDFPSLGNVNGSLIIVNNTVLASIYLPSLSAVVEYFQILNNPSLTFTHLPRLTFIGGFIAICLNSPAFLIPSGPPNAPTGGLVVTGQFKGQPQCHYQQGSNVCSSLVTCL